MFFTIILKLHFLGMWHCTWLLSRFKYTCIKTPRAFEGSLSAFCVAFGYQAHVSLWPEIAVPRKVMYSFVSFRLPLIIGNNYKYSSRGNSCCPAANNMWSASQAPSPVSPEPCPASTVCKNTAHVHVAAWCIYMYAVHRRAQERPTRWDRALTSTSRRNRLASFRALSSTCSAALTSASAWHRRKVTLHLTSRSTPSLWRYCADAVSFTGTCVRVRACTCRHGCMYMYSPRYHLIQFTWWEVVSAAHVA